MCVNCGCPPLSGTSFCQNCGADTASAAVACVKCGAKLAKDPEGEGKSKFVAGLLGIFLGSLGIHRFYLGYTAVGIIQIVVTIITLGIGALWGFIEGIVILAGGWKTDAHGVPLTKDPRENNLFSTMWLDDIIPITMKVRAL
jgi:TM2 domain-containing membrane protein YozV